MLKRRGIVPRPGSGLGTCAIIEIFGRRHFCSLCEWIEGGEPDSSFSANHLRMLRKEARGPR